MLDLVIRNGFIVDGSGLPGRNGDVSTRFFRSSPGRTFAKRRKCFRNGKSDARSGCSCGGSFSHFGPPTEPKRIASAARQAARVESGKALPCRSMPTPPTSWVEWSSVWPDLRSTASRIGRATAMTSGPI